MNSSKALFVFAIAILQSSPVRAQSDECATAPSIFGTGSFPITNFNATDSGSPASCHFGASHDVWYSWTTGAANDYLFSVCGYPLNPTIAIYDSCGGSEIACMVPAGCANGLGGTELVVFGLSANTTYIIQADGQDGDIGLGGLDIELVVVPPNDECDAAIVLDTFGSLQYDTFFATDSGVGTSCSPRASKDLWFELTTGVETNYRFSLGSSSLPELSMALYSACGGTEIVCKTGGACPNDIPQLLATGLTPHTTYWLQVDGGFGWLNWGPFDFAPEDECLGAQSIAGTGLFPISIPNASDSGTASSCLPPGSGLATGASY